MIRQVVTGALALAALLGGAASVVEAQSAPAPPPPTVPAPAPPASAGPAPAPGPTVPAPAPPALPGPAPAPPGPPPELVAAGRALFVVACTSCHGGDGRGTGRGPSLVGAGPASADFYLSTGRMPLDRPRKQAPRKQPAYDRRQIDQLVAYVASLGPGPERPTVDLAEGQLPDGEQLFSNNCAPCHSSAGAGGALGHSVAAPALRRATPVQVAEAVRIGPGAMPVFGPETLDDHQVASIVRYVQYLRHPDDRGGLGLGHLGPIPEGFVAWLVGLGAMVAAIRWIGTTD